MDMLTKLTVVIISQYICVAIITLYALNLHNVVCQLYLNKTGGGGSSGARIGNSFCLILSPCPWLLFILYPSYVTKWL